MHLRPWTALSAATVAITAWSFAQSGAAITLCSGPCPPETPIPPPVEIISLQVPLSPIVPPSLTILVQDGEDFDLAFFGDVVVSLTGISVLGTTLSFESVGELRVASGLVFAADEIRFCPGEICGDPIDPNPGLPQIGVRLSAHVGTVRIATLGDLTIVPEPATGLLAAVGLAVLAGQARRSTRQTVPFEQRRDRGKLHQRTGHPVVRELLGEQLPVKSRKPRSSPSSGSECA